VREPKRSRSGDHNFDVVGAGQCWHWFDRRRAAVEARRVLTQGGLMVIASFDWIALEGNVVEATEQLIQAQSEVGAGRRDGNPSGVRARRRPAGFGDIECFSFDVLQPYSHEAWRGRIRASAGIAASLGPQEVARFDDELRETLARRFPENPMRVHHRTFAMVCRVPLDARRDTD
jgi:SAM-dependent methyltransferase